MRFQDIFGPPEDDDVYEEDDFDDELDEIDDDFEDDDDFEEEDEDEEDEEEDDEDEPKTGDVSWDVTEFKIRDWVEKDLDAEHVGWVEDKLLKEDVPAYKTEAEVAEVLDNIPLAYMGLKDTAGIYLDCNDGEVFVLFDDRPESNIIKDKDYERGIKGKMTDVSKILKKNGLVRTVKIINEKRASRIAWTVGNDSD